MQKQSSLHVKTNNMRHVHKTHTYSFKICFKKGYYRLNIKIIIFLNLKIGRDTVNGACTIIL